MVDDLLASGIFKAFLIEDWKKKEEGQEREREREEETLFSLFFFGVEDISRGTNRVLSDHQMLVHIKRAHHLEAEVEKVQEDLRAEGVLRKEFVSVELKAALALEEKRKKEAEIKVAKFEARMAKSILEVMIQTVKEFKASFKIRNLNVEFEQQTFIEGFKLCEGRVA
ncbi:hypothetical protein COCNU_09G001060 [Cocos nucifera]|uniref:Uncharacterized protein n=1 Tax=Cocos nucifera TaxID=13894 RepID=A0A8K0IIP3_COCNU|nr:hypothetical protein COCNU_09G001060 [Cocos nucifera]